MDINGIPGLIRRTDGVLRIGATVRQAALERSVVAEHWPLLRQALRLVGHPATRSRGTVGGSVAHADPRAELVCALTALDARYETTQRLLATAPVLAPRGRHRRQAARVRSARGPPSTARPRSLRANCSSRSSCRRSRPARVPRSSSTPAPGATSPTRPRPSCSPRSHAAIAVFAAGRATPPSCPRALAARRPPSAPLRDGATAAEAAALAASLVDGDHPRALVAELTRRALVQAGRA